VLWVSRGQKSIQLNCYSTGIRIPNPLLLSTRVHIKPF
jgi:hypothetical protein